MSCGPSKATALVPTENVALKAKTKELGDEIRIALVAKTAAEASEKSLRENMETQIKLAEVNAKMAMKDAEMAAYKEGMDRMDKRKSPLSANSWASVASQESPYSA